MIHIIIWKFLPNGFCASLCTDKKENQIFLIFKEIQSGAVEKWYMRKGFLIDEEMRKYFTIYEKAVSHIWLCNCSIVNFLIYEVNLILFFISVGWIKSTWDTHCHARIRHALCTRKDKQNRSRLRRKNAGREDKEGRAVHCKKRYAVFPSPAGMSLTKLSLAGKN
jgi:hypothetical protein